MCGTPAGFAGPTHMSHLLGWNVQFFELQDEKSASCFIATTGGAVPTLTFYALKIMKGRRREGAGRD